MQTELPHPRALTLFLTVLPLFFPALPHLINMGDSSWLPGPNSSLYSSVYNWSSHNSSDSLTDHEQNDTLRSPHSFCPRMLQHVTIDRALHRKERPLWPPSSVLLVLFTVYCFKRFPSGVCRNELMQHTASFQIITCKNKLIHFNKPIMVMFWNRFFVLVCAVIAKMSPLSSLDISSNSLKTILWWTKNYAVKNNVNITVFTPEQTDWLLSLTYKEPHFISSSEKQNLEYSFVYSCKWLFQYIRSK